ncbi:MAG: hypothetical protein L3J53_00345 [Proteobacteria bacterium]|nr:hypothetical protein [Pseudomonadota bacterium]
MKIYILLGVLLSQSSLANPTNPKWNLKPKLEQQLTKALECFFICTAGKTKQ